MPTTSNFGWTTPADTDLVKDGAAAIRTLGNGIDTSFLDLKGGTTGQVLSKASNTDLDFSWVAQDDSNAIQNALLTTTGDTIYASGASTPARLGIGTAGQLLRVNSGATAPEWATIATGALTELASGTLTGASVTTGSLSQSYKNLYLVLVDPLPANDGANCNVRFNSDTTSNYGSSTSNIPTFTNWPATMFAISGTMDNSVGNNIAVATVYNYTDSIYKMIDSLAITVNASTTTDTNGRKGFGAYGSTSAITTVTFLPDSGNWSSGTYYVYGVK